MPASRKPITIHPDVTTDKQFEALREYFSKKNGGIEITNSQLGRWLIEEKYAEIVDGQNNRARITNIVQGQAEMKQAQLDLKQEITELRLQVAQLTIALMEKKEGKQL